MGSSLYQRLEGKSADDGLIERIGESFNLAPMFGRTYFEEMRRLFAEHLRLPGKAATLLLHALAADEPAGKPLKDCRKVLVELRLEAPGDLELWRDRGRAALRQGKVLRLTHEALEQGALLTQEEPGAAAVHEREHDQGRHGGTAPRWLHGAHARSDAGQLGPA